jgi:hypothetical protein
MVDPETGELISDAEVAETTFDRPLAHLPEHWPRAD